SSSGNVSIGQGGAGGGDQPVLPAISMFCRDGVVDVTDPIQEECDDGEGTQADLCNVDCRVTDTAVVPLPATVRNPLALANRYLGEGRHPVAGSAHGFGVVFVERAADTALIGLSVFDPAGDPRAKIEVSGGADPVLFANPVVAALSSGDYAVAWTN